MIFLPRYDVGAFEADDQRDVEADLARHRGEDARRR